MGEVIVTECFGRWQFSFPRRMMEEEGAGFCGWIVVPFRHVDLEVPMRCDMEMSVGYMV